jgi:predicted nucleic acid-binding protein
MSDKDIFYLDKVFPEPDKIFSFEYETLDTVASDCIFVLDTNVLFVPFDTSEKNLDEIKQIFLSLKKGDRLFLPARVVREFANNRAKRLGDLFQKVRQNKENLNSGNFKIDDYPLLQGNAGYQTLVENYKTIGDLIKSCRKLLEQVEADILSWNWDDNVSKVYKEIFTPELIIEVKKTEEDLIKDLKFRIEFKIAPGYKDSGKLDDGIGDLVIWQTALEIAKDKNKHLILVSNDQKNDWFYRQEKQGLYPRYELFDEFRRFTGGKSMHIVSFPKFLEILHAKPETVDEIKETIRNYEIRRRHQKTELVEGMLVEHPKFGIGKIARLDVNPVGHVKATVNFADSGIKQLLVRFASLRVIDNEHNALLNEHNALLKKSDLDEDSSLSNEE